MASYAKLVADAGEQYLSKLAETQETFLKNAAAFTEQVASVTHAIPQPAVVAGIPTVQEVSEANFAFAEKLLKQQKSFAEKLLAAGTPPPSKKAASK